jgi:3-oxoadipate enol-lactonase
MSLQYESDEAQLSFRDTGNGVPMILLHPTPLDGDFWRPVVDQLDGVRTIIPDLRGHGTSELGTRLPSRSFGNVQDAPALSVGQLASDVLALLDHLKIETAVFAGCSIGGYVLLELWRRAPDRMRGLAFVCSKPQPDAEANWEKRAATIAQAREGRTSAVFDGMAQTLVSATAREKRPEMMAELRAHMTLTADALIAVQAGLATRPDSVPTVASITVPVLAVTGGEDGSVTPEEMETFCAVPGGCTYVLLADAGHLAAYEQPSAVAARMQEWLRLFE